MHSYGVPLRPRSAIRQPGSKALLCLAFALAQQLYANVLTALVCMTAAGYVYMFYTYQPFYNARVNQAHVAMASVFLWAALSLVLLRIRHKPEVCDPLPCYHYRCNAPLSSTFPPRGIRELSAPFGGAATEKQALLLMCSCAV